MVLGLLIGSKFIAKLILRKKYLYCLALIYNRIRDGVRRLKRGIFLYRPVSIAKIGSIILNLHMSGGGQGKGRQGERGREKGENLE